MAGDPLNEGGRVMTATHHGGSGTQSGGGQVSAEMQRCIQECLDCHRACLETMTYCLQAGGALADGALVRVLLDCAEMCEVSAGFMLRGSDSHGRTCAACAEICARCAEACERQGDDAQLRACAEACRRCAESCRSMAAGSG
jgi:hypothetical protein